MIYFMVPKKYVIRSDIEPISATTAYNYYKNRYYNDLYLLSWVGFYLQLFHCRLVVLGNLYY